MSEDKRNIAGITEDVTPLIIRYRAGDDVAFDKLTSIYRPLIDSMVNHCYAGVPEAFERDDLVQYALLAFSKAALTYNLEQSEVSFGLYAKICIGNSFASKIRSVRKKHPPVLPLDSVFDMADSYDIAGGVIDRENVENLGKLIESNLSDFENTVFRLFAGGFSSSEIAERLGKTEKSVDNAIFRARNKLKKVLNGAYNKGPI